MAAKQVRRKPKSRERYTLDALESVFPGGHWVEDVKIRELLPSAVGGDPGLETAVNPTSSPYIAPTEITSTAYITVIGGTKYEKTTMSRYMSDAWVLGATIVVGGGRGVESDLAKEAWGDIIVLEPDVEMFGKAARKVNVEQVLAFDPESPLLLVGSGERVKQAQQWLKRARWTREVVELP